MYAIVAKPALIPLTIPEPVPTPAIAVAPLLHTPPEDVSLNTVIDPVQTPGIPLIAPGVGLTVTIAVFRHPVVKE